MSSDENENKYEEVNREDSSDENSTINLSSKNENDTFYDYYVLITSTSMTLFENYVTNTANRCSNNQKALYITTCLNSEFIIKYRKKLNDFKTRFNASMIIGGIDKELALTRLIYFYDYCYTVSKGEEWISDKSYVPPNAVYHLLKLFDTAQFQEMINAVCKEQVDEFEKLGSEIVDKIDEIVDKIDKEKISIANEEIKIQLSKIIQLDIGCHTTERNAHQNLILPYIGCVLEIHNIIKEIHNSILIPIYQLNLKIQKIEEKKGSCFCVNCKKIINQLFPLKKPVLEPLPLLYKIYERGVITPLYFTRHLTPPDHVGLSDHSYEIFKGESSSDDINIDLSLDEKIDNSENNNDN